MTVPHLLFDVMGTLVYDPFYRELPAFFDMTLEELIRVKHPTAWAEFERGEIDDKEFLDRFFLDGRAYDHDAFRSVMFDTYRWLDGIPEILVRLHEARRPVHLVSNYPVWYREVDSRVGLSCFADWTWVSCHAGYRKPEARVFETVCREIGAAPADCLFVDDQATNVEAAREAGLDAVLFRDATDLSAALTARGVLIRSAP